MHVVYLRAALRHLVTDAGGDLAISGFAVKLTTSPSSIQNGLDCVSNLGMKEAKTVECVEQMNEG